MIEFCEFITTVNTSLHAKELPRLELICMPANFSSIVGEFVSTVIPKYCATVRRNTYHNGHPDMVPTGQFPNDSVQHSNIGIEIKASRSRLSDQNPLISS
jgi:hypothetical protein